MARTKNFLKRLFGKTEERICIRCNKPIKGSPISVNVYERVVGQGKGIIHDHCEIAEGSPEWVKRYWIEHFLDVMYRPDYFGKSTYQECWDEQIEFMEKHGRDFYMERIKKYNLPDYIRKYFPNTWDK